ncbi:Tumor suppressor candidate 2, partial [Eschrichtius robustus]|nr:Tumor suppressor candidate 2 [Eschrichtius robustus]
MGASGSKARGLWPFAWAAARRLLSLSKLWCDCEAEPWPPSYSRAAAYKLKAPILPHPQFSLEENDPLFCLSMFYDEDGDLAHEFYEETIVTKNGQKRAKLRRVHKNLIPQGIVKLDPPRIHVDFPVILYEV